MTEAFFFRPDKPITGTELDGYLALGGYRMGQHVFTTHFILHGDCAYRVLWLRYSLARFRLHRKGKDLLRRNASFSVREQPLKITREMEDLYKRYRDSLDFEPSTSVREWLIPEGDSNVFDTRCVEVRDENRLLAVGMYDTGRDATAGILNFYDPAYGRFSLGKFLMLWKILRSMEEGKRWYYPGYLVQGLPKFDYKLFAGREAVEVFLPELRGWFPYEEALLRL